MNKKILNLNFSIFYFSSSNHLYQINDLIEFNHVLIARFEHN
jgi:hypothetical protein